MPKAVRGLLEKALHEAGLAGTIKRQLPKQVWDAVVGPEIAARAQPTVLTAGALHVLVEDHRWRDQLDAMRGELIRRLNAKLGKPVVRELRFGLAHAGALGARLRTLGAPHGMARESLRAIAKPLPAISDLPPHLRCAERLSPELREIFLRAGQAAARATELRA